MPLVKAKCTNCGANLEVDNTKDAAICPYCGTAYIVEKAINNYNITNNIHANVVNVYGGNSADFVIRAGSLEKYNGASTDVIIPSSVTRISGYAFSSCYGLESVVIPESVKIIEDGLGYCGTFSRCSSLKSVSLSYGIEEIGGYAFYGCKSLVSISIPASVKKIGKRAFEDCSALTNVVIEGNPTLEVYSDEDYSSSYVFDGCEHLHSIQASDEWKAQNWEHADCLKQYRPQSQGNSSNSSSGHCYIATAVYGSYNCPQVYVLRRYRDNQLASTFIGRQFIRCYYALSPILIQWFGKKQWFQSFWKKHLDEFVMRLKKAGMSDTPYCDK